MFSSTRKMALAATVSALAMASTVQAEGFFGTSPEEFFAEMQALYGSVGYELTAESSEMQGETLVLTNVTYSFDSPQMSGSVTTESWEISPTDEEGYEIVLVASPAHSLVMSSTDPALAEMGDIEASFELTDNRLLVGGSPEERTYLYTLASMTMSFSGLTVEAPDGGSAQGDMVITANDLSFEAELEAGEEYEYSGSAASMVIDYNLTGPDGEMAFDITYSGMSMEGDGPLVDMADTAAIFAGKMTEMEFTYDSSAMEMTIADTLKGENLTASLTSGEGELEMEIGGGGIDYRGEGEDTVLVITGNTLPFPQAELRMERAGGRFAMPLVPTGETGELAIELSLVGLTMSDQLWGMFDPGGAISRDPANLILRATADAEALVDFSDPAAMEGVEEPLRVDSVQLEEFELSIAGAVLTAAGAVDIDNSGAEPRPSGGLDLSLNGALALLEQLSAAGLLPPPQAAAFPAMLEAFAVKGDAEDSFTSRLEMGPDGAVTLNGMPLQ